MSFSSIPGHFDLQSDVVLVFVDVDGGGKARGGQGLILASVAIGLAEHAVHAVLQGGKLTERFKTGKYGHGKSSFKILLCWYLQEDSVSARSLALDV